MCLALTPLVLEITAALRRNPVPYLLAVAMASNVGSVATITGNPQNMMIASFSGIAYREFAAALAPVALAGVIVTVAVIAFVYRAEFRSAAPMSLDPRPARYNRALLWKSVAVSAAMVAFFFAGWPVSKVAIVAGAVLLLIGRVRSGESGPSHRLAVTGDVRRIVRRDRGSRQSALVRRLARRRCRGSSWVISGYFRGSRRFCRTS